MSFSKTTGTVTVLQRIVLKINKELFEGRVEGSFYTLLPYGRTGSAIKVYNGGTAEAE